MRDRNSRQATVCGFGAIGLWSANLGLSRILAEHVGAMAAGAGIFLIAGVLGSVWFYRSADRRRQLRALSWRYRLGCGAMFVACSVCLYLAVGKATGRQQVLEVSLINYLWPALTLVFSIPMFGYRARPLFFLGVALALGGVVAATWPAGGLQWSVFVGNLRDNAWPYLFAAAAAVLWAVYSNGVRLWGGSGGGAGVPAFMFAGGVVMAGLALPDGLPASIPPKVAMVFLVMGLGPALAAYILWDIAMGRGNAALVASGAYLTPILSTLASCLLLDVLPGMTFWLGCGAVVGGAILCKRSLH